MAARAEAKAAGQFAEIDRIALENTTRVMQAFQDNRVAEACFSGTTGYGYDDLGRDTLDKIYAQVFGAESAIVRIGFVNGTHAITCAMFSLCAPGEKLLSINGAPYDTLRGAIGIGENGATPGSLAYYGVGYDQVNLLPDSTIDFESVSAKLKSDKTIKAVIMQRSCGYDDRKTLTVAQIGEAIKKIKAVRPDVNVFVDNCYGEFVDTLEPTHVGADLIAGSLIKNPGGSIAPTGGYIAGRAELVERAAFRMTVPGIGGECGSTLGNNRLLYQGFFMAPHVTAQAVKTAVFAAAMMDEAGIESFPKYNEKRSDIIQRIRVGSPERMKKFCAGIQAGAPVDSYVTPEPWAMPGYDCDVIMAAGAFIQGASIELSADGPFKEPYDVFLQGGITYESGKLGVMMAVNGMTEE